ncbi:MAG: hypothetical protein R3C44_13480 [Chloroflexota bacterium]
MHKLMLPETDRYIFTTIEETQGSLLNDADGVPFMRMSGKVWFKCARMAQKSNLVTFHALLYGAEVTSFIIPAPSCYVNAFYL